MKVVNIYCEPKLLDDINKSNGVINLTKFSISDNIKKNNIINFICKENDKVVTVKIKKAIIVSRYLNIFDKLIESNEWMKNNKEIDSYKDFLSSNIGLVSIEFDILNSSSLVMGTSFDFDDEFYRVLFDVRNKYNIEKEDLFVNKENFMNLYSPDGILKYQKNKISDDYFNGVNIELVEFIKSYLRGSIPIKIREISPLTIEHDVKFGLGFCDNLFNSHDGVKLINELCNNNISKAKELIAYLVFLHSILESRYVSNSKKMLTNKQIL